MCGLNNPVCSSFVQSIRDETGATAIEYGLIASGVAVAISAAIFVLGGDISTLFGGVRSSPVTISDQSEPILMTSGFEVTDGFGKVGWGALGPAGDFAGWQNLANVRPEYIRAGYMGIEGGEGLYMLDMEGSPGNMHIGQTLDDLASGEIATLHFLSADPRRNNGVEVWWGGESVATFNPEGREMASYSVELIGGTGDGANFLEIRGTGPEDNVGAAIDSIEVRRGKDLR